MSDNLLMGDPLPKPLTIEEAARRFPDIVESVSKKNSRVTVTAEDGATVVLMNAKDLESLEETLALLNDPEAMADIREGLEEIRSGSTVPLDELYPR